MSDQKSPNTITNKSIKTVDAIVTWVILWWVIASIYGIKKAHEKKGILQKETNIDQTTLFDEKSEENTKKSKGFFRTIFWK